MKFFKLLIIAFSMISLLLVAGCEKEAAKQEVKEAAPVQAKQSMLEMVRAKGFIQAGVNGSVFGFSAPDENGVWKGLDVDTARAISVSVFGTPDNVKYTPLTAVQRFTALQSGEIDVLTRNCTQTLGREHCAWFGFCDR